MGENGLKNETIKALIWSFTDRFGQQIIYLVTGIILARTLSPSDYGLVGLLTIFTALSNLFIESGLGGALIKKKQTTNIDYCSVFYFNIGLSCLFYLFLFFFAPYIAEFYDEPQLTLLARVLFLALICNSFSFIQSNIFVKQIKFNSLARINIAALFCSSVIAVILAILQFGAWALVAQTLCLTAFRSLFLWMFSQWRPTERFSIEPLKEFFSFSSKVLLTGFLNAFFNNIYSVIIGKYFNKMELGFYQQASKFQDIPSSLIAGTFRSVALPVFSDVNNDNERLKRVLKKTQKSIAFIAFPVFLVLIIIARPLFVFLITEKWLPAVELFQLLLVGGIFNAISIVYNELLLSKGRSGLYLRMELVKKTFLILSVISCISFGVKGLVAGWVIYSFLSFLISAIWAGKIVSYSLRELFTDIFPYAVIAFIMAMISYLFIYLHVSDVLLMCIQITFCFTFYMGACRIFKPEIMQETFSYLKHLKDKKK